MISERISVELDADCAWALQQIAVTTGESHQAILRAAVGHVWNRFAAAERIYRDAAMAEPGASLVHGHSNVVDLENCRKLQPDQEI